jgi:hypothetical protein
VPYIILFLKFGEPLQIIVSVMYKVDGLLSTRCTIPYISFLKGEIKFLSLLDNKIHCD